MIELPKDANGKEIPLSTKVLYRANGNTFSVRSFQYNPNDEMWRVEDLGGLVVETGLYTLEPLDSWERLLRDLDRGSAKELSCCKYFDCEISGCDGCPAQGKGCARAVLADIADRIRKLRGKNDD